MQPRPVGSVMPAEPAGPSTPASLWRLWTGPHAHHAAFRTARSALAALLAERSIRRLWLPAYTCAEVASAGVGLEIAWLPVDRSLAIDTAPLAALRPGDAVLGIDYFGRSPGPAFRALAAARPDVLWIEDRAQALAPDAPAWGEVLLYSPRKLIGVADGGLLVSDAPLPSPAPGADDPGLWAPEDARALDPGGRDPSSWFPLFREREAAFAIDRAPMSRRTRAALESLDAKAVIAARQANYARLLAHLGDYALWPGAPPAFAPLAFPVLVEDRDGVAGRMAERGLFCAKHWAQLPCPRDGVGDAWALAAHILSIPCDQRYGAADMDRAAEALLAAARPAALR